MQPRMVIRYFISLIALVAATSSAQLSGARAELDAKPQFKAHLVTMSPGKLVYERFGHNVIFITDFTRGSPVTVAYDFGNFDFNQADFVRRFVFGEMRYWAEEKDPLLLLEGYAADNRQIYRQELNLTDEQVQQLWINLRENIRQENRYYHYDYYRDNCSTRLRDQIDRVTGGQLAAQLGSRPARRTFRWHSRVGMDSNRVLLAGIEFAVAMGVDRAVTRWDECFLPEQLRQNISETTIRSPAGAVIPLVRLAGEMNPYIDKSKLVTLPEEPPWPMWWFAPAGLLAGTTFAAVGALAVKYPSMRWAAAVLWGGWGLVAGLAGSLLVFFWIATRHVASYANENLLQLSPLALLLLILGPMIAFGRSVEFARWVARALLAMCLLGVMLKVLPNWRQDNAAVIVFALLSQAGLLIGMLMRVPRPSGAGKEPDS